MYVPCHVSLYNEDLPRETRGTHIAHEVRTDQNNKENAPLCMRSFTTTGVSTMVLHGRMDDSEIPSGSKPHADSTPLQLQSCVQRGRFALACSGPVRVRPANGRLQVPCCLASADCRCHCVRMPLGSCCAESCGGFWLAHAVRAPAVHCSVGSRGNRGSRGSRGSSGRAFP